MNVHPLQSRIPSFYPFAVLAAVALLTIVSTSLPAQMGGGQPAGPLPSPAATANVNVAGGSITIKYNSPQVRGREGDIFTPGGLIQKTHKSYPVWRAGADPATALHTTADLTIGNLNVPAGNYTLFVDIANPNQWLLIVSKDTGEWGLAYNEKNDLGRTPMTMSKPPAMVEDLKYTLTSDGGNKGTLTLEWENKRASVNFVVH
ncbi:MAG: DUF2911 domain-containing protein [Acidobacteriaceae bacterium]